MSLEKRSGSRCCAAAAGQIRLLVRYSLAEMSFDAYDLPNLWGVAQTLSEGESSVAIGRLNMACLWNRWSLPRW